MIEPVQTAAHGITENTPDGAVCMCGRVFKHRSLLAQMANAQQHVSFSVNEGTREARKADQLRQAKRLNAAAEKAAFDRLKRLYRPEYERYIEEEKAKRGIQSRKALAEGKRIRRHLIARGIDPDAVPEPVEVGEDAEDPMKRSA